MSKIALQKFGLTPLSYQAEMPFWKYQLHDYDDMNVENFLKWFCDILPLLKVDAVIVLDNGPYHSVKSEKIPTSSWTKPAIVQWLESKTIEPIWSNQCENWTTVNSQENKTPVWDLCCGWRGKKTE